LQQNSAGRCSSPTSFAISPKMRDDTGSTCELLHAHGIFATTPSWVLAQPALPDVCRDLAMLAERHYAAGAEAIAACPRWTMRPVAVMLGVYRALLDELLAGGWRQFDQPVRVPAWRELALVIRHGLAGR